MTESEKEKEREEKLYNLFMLHEKINRLTRMKEEAERKKENKELTLSFIITFLQKFQWGMVIVFGILAWNYIGHETFTGIIAMVALWAICSGIFVSVTDILILRLIKISYPTEDPERKGRRMSKRYEQKNLVVILTIWSFIHLFALAYSRSPFTYSYESREYFFPSGSSVYEISQIYDMTEFVFYVGTPWLLYLLRKYMKKARSQHQ